MNFSRHKSHRLFYAYALFSVSLLIGHVCIVRAADPSTRDNEPNGISVGRPKVYDGRTLALMLESQSQSLQALQFIDQHALATALGATQGYSATSSVTNISAATLPTASGTREVDTTKGALDSSGKPIPDSTTTKTTSSQAAIAPQPPALDTLPTFSGYSPTYSESAADLLSDEVNLVTQVATLRLLLDQSIGDRLYGDNPRLQAVLGFNVSLDPPRTARDAVGVLEVTLHKQAACVDAHSTASVTQNLHAPTKDANRSETVADSDNIALVTMLPQEKTYNSAALSQESHAFGGAAVAKIIQIGASTRRQSETFYLYRDADTLAFQQMQPEADAITFGWTFRPVLGRRSVSPGMRQLFAVVALPERNSNENDERTAAFPLCAIIRTYWKRYDAKGATSFEPRDANRSTRFLYGISLGLMRPEIFESRYTNEVTYRDIIVRGTKSFQADLSPKVFSARWVPLGSKNALISVEGENFFSGTQVVIGDKTYVGGGDGLTIKSDKAFDLMTTLDALAGNTAEIVGRYGPSISLLDQSELGRVPLAITGARIEPANGGARLVVVSLSPRDGDRAMQPQALLERGLPKANAQLLKPVVSINGTPVPSPYYFLVDNTGLKLEFLAPDSLLSNASGILRVVWPFLGDGWSLSYPIADPATEFQIYKLGSKNIVLSTKNWLGFTRDHDGQPGKAPWCWHLEVDGGSLSVPTAVCKAGLAAGSKAVSDYAAILQLPDGSVVKGALIDPYGAMFPLDWSKDASAAKSTTPQTVAINQFDATWVDVAVDAPDAVAATADAGGNPVKVRPAKGKGVQVQLTQAITSKPGDVDITLTDKSGAVVLTQRVHIVCVTCAYLGAKQ